MGLTQAEGKRKGRKNGNKPKREGDGKQSEGNAADKTRLTDEDPATTRLRDATAEEREAWGRINDRDVAHSLRELWDKIPQSYRLMVTQYFTDITAPDFTDITGPEPAKVEEKASK